MAKRARGQSKRRAGRSRRPESQRARRAPEPASAPLSPARPSRRGRPRWWVAAALISVALGFIAVWIVARNAKTSGEETARDQAREKRAGPNAPVERLGVRVIRRYPHQRDAFTQGLLWDDGVLYESTGGVGHSSLRKVELETGEVLRQQDNDASLFGEGLALAGDLLVQLTWRNGRALVFRQRDFALVREHAYEGEGWGLCYDGASLVMSDGSDQLVFRDPVTFAERGAVSVTLEGKPVARLNELECVAGAVWANVWKTESIVRIDPESGHVTAVVDASGLLAADERAGTDVLNGIAWMPERSHFLVTGKNWPWMFEVAFEPSR